MQTELSHERLDLYRVYLEVAGKCGEIISGGEQPIAVFDHSGVEPVDEIG